MAKENRAYFGQNGKLKVTKQGSTETIDLAIVQNWKANVEYETNDLYGIGSIYRQAAARYNAKVTVSCEFCAIPDDLKAGLVGWIIDPINGTGQTTSASDTTTLAMFQFVGEFRSQDTKSTVTITVDNVYFANFPWEASTGEWIKCNIEGTGSSYSISNVQNESLIAEA